MSQTHPFRLESATGRPIDGLIDLPATSGPHPVVVVCHGFKGFMEWGFFPALAELLAERGFVAVRFNFSGSGQRPGEDRASDLPGFRANTFTREQEDLRAVLEGLDCLTPEMGELVDRQRVGLFGHSRGGAAAILTAGEPTLGGTIGALVTWAAVSHLDRWDDETRRRWRDQGELLVPNSRTGQEMPLGVGLLDDLEKHRDELDVRAAAGRVRCPWLIVHGEDDESVPVEEARELARATGSQQAEDALLLLGGTGHTFGAVHPFAGPTPHLIQALNATQTWFRRHLVER